MLDDHQAFTVTDIKQFAFCQRVIFYECCLPHIRPRTYKMDAGRDAHDEEQRRAERRSLSRHHLAGGRRLFDVPVRSERLNLVGEIDEVVYGANGEIVPVDYKLTKQVSHHHRVQLTAYVMMLEEVEQTAIEQGCIYLIPKRKLTTVQITPGLRAEVEAILIQMTAMIEREQMPEPTSKPNLCVSCEFRRFCNDV